MRYLRKLALSRIPKICYCATHSMSRSTYDEIIAVVYSKQGRLFFVDRPGGTGKTFLYRALLVKLHSQDKLALATATSRVTASIMLGERRPTHVSRYPSLLKRAVAVASQNRVVLLSCCSKQLS
jgi:hypothetical protein